MIFSKSKDVIALAVANGRLKSELEQATAERELWKHAAEQMASQAQDEAQRVVAARAQRQ